MKSHWIILSLAALAPVVNRAADFEFVVIGDTRPRFESESFRPFERLIAKINALKPAFVINLGDLIYGYGPRSKQEQWDKYEAVRQTIRVPYYQLPGNHDTHSKEARRIYGERFGKFYQSFDYADCHFVLLDNTQEGRWGYLGPTELEWLKNDLRQTRARSVFVFMHFPVWEPERITPEYYAFWEHTLHPLFKASRVRAVFAGHYHAYGPTREFDGIRYYITGGGGAELRPEYRKAGGVHHFMRVRVSGNTFDVRIVTEHGELTDPEADVMGGLLFAARNVSRIGIERGPEDLPAGVRIAVSVANPYRQTLTGHADWVMDASAFSVEPQEVAIRVPAGARQTYRFTLKARRATTLLPSQPRLEFDVRAGSYHHRFQREVRFLQEIRTPFRSTAPVLDGRLSDWNGVPALPLREDSQPAAELRAVHDDKELYLALTVPGSDAADAKQSGFIDQLQIGIAQRTSDTDFGNDFLRLGFSRDTAEARDRTPGHNPTAVLPGVVRGCRSEDHRTTYEIGIPFRLLHLLKGEPHRRLVLDVSFPLADAETESEEPANPELNTFTYRVRYGSDSLVPVYFVGLNLE